MDALIDSVVDLEWDFFQEVDNEGGKASCQNNRPTFDIMRKSQFLAWDRATLESYRQDLLDARRDGRNPLAEKYARMMERTANAEYRKMESLLPPVLPEVRQLVEEIVAIQMPWQKEYTKLYSRLATRSRPVDSASEAGYATSVETYLRGELMTYSKETLRRYLAHIKALQERGKNITLEIMEYTVRKYGYASLQAAEDAVAASAVL